MGLPGALAPGPAAALFVGGTATSLCASWVLAQRIERVAERLGASEAILGLIAALAADAPEITSAVSALAHHQQAVGAGVVVGSNVFNLAALLGVGALAARRIALHRRVVLLTGAVALWVALVCLAVLLGVLPPGEGLVLALVAIIPDVALAAAGRETRLGLPVPERWRRWLAQAVHEEELELRPALHPLRGRPADTAAALGALVVVVIASVAMERAAVDLGGHFGVPQIVTGGVVLAAVTSLPNAVAAVYLGLRGRGSAVLSTALNSNALNVTIGLLLPAAILGIGPGSASRTLVGAWYVGMTLLALALAYGGRGLSRRSGTVIVGAYLAFLVALLATAGAT